MSDSNINHKERDYYNRIIDKVRENLKIKMNVTCKKYGLDYELVRLLVELEFEQEIHYKIKVNRILFNYEFHGD